MIPWPPCCIRSEKVATPPPSNTNKWLSWVFVLFAGVTNQVQGWEDLDHFNLYFSTVAGGRVEIDAENVELERSGMMLLPTDGVSTTRAWCTPDLVTGRICMIDLIIVATWPRSQTISALSSKWLKLNCRWRRSYAYSKVLINISSSRVFLFANSTPVPLIVSFAHCI